MTLRLEAASPLLQSGAVSAEPFYMPEPDLFGHRFAYERYTGYAADLEEAGLVDCFPLDADVRRITIELLADRYVVSDVVENPDLIDAAVDEARTIFEELI